MTDIFITFAAARSRTSFRGRRRGADRQDESASAGWTAVAAALPHYGSRVEFVLEHRDMAMPGVYEGMQFHSRSSRYPLEAISEWRYVEACPRDA